jgi:iron complex transport system substrate-binding protein
MKRLMIGGLLLTLFLSGCGSSKPTTTTSSPATGGFPVTVHTATGTVTIEQRPSRIMSLSATATGMLYAIGAGPQVVAVDKYSTDPPNAPRTRLTGYETGPESYLPYHPDLVVLANDQSGGMVHELGLLHIPALLLPAAPSIAASFQQFETLGLATGHVTAAQQEVGAINTRLNAIVRAVGNHAKGLTYYHELDPTLYTATSRTFIGALYARLGMVNVADPAAHGGNQYPQLSAEFLIRANPDFVFLADSVCCGQTPNSFGRRAGFRVLRAVRLHHVFSIPDPIASEWGPRMVDFLTMVAHDVDPGAQL